MPTTPLKCFTAVLEPLSNGMGWVVARIPFDPARAWPQRRRMRVRGEVFAVGEKTGGFSFRSSLMPYSSGEGYFLVVNRKMQAACKARAGSSVRICMEPDLEERSAATPPELARALKADRRLKPWMEKLSESNRREIAWWVTEPKSPEARQQRAERMAERLLLTLEGEIELPPILEATFRRQPAARAGWQAMTAHQRRCHLLGIFNYQGVEARERRAAKAVEEALRMAGKATKDQG
jgi:uncharacterized protein YdeI (YjbR/CyaY-like superfamily)